MGVDYFGKYYLDFDEIFFFERYDKNGIVVFGDICFGDAENGVYNFPYFLWELCFVFKEGHFLEVLFDSFFEFLFFEKKVASLVFKRIDESQFVSFC